MKVARLRPPNLARELGRAWRQRNWRLAFQLAARLCQPGISPTEILAVRQFERGVKIFIHQTARSGNKALAKTMAVALRKFQRATNRFLFVHGPQRKDSPRGLKPPGVKFRKPAPSPTPRPPSASGGGFGFAGPRSLEERMLEQTTELHRKSIGKGAVRPSKPPKAKKQETGIIERIPHMDMEPTSSQDRYQVIVFANTTPPDPGAEVKPLRIRVPSSIKQFTVKASFRCSAHFQNDGPDVADLVFERSEAESTKASFFVVLRESRNPAPMFFQVLFRYNDRPSGKITRFPEYNSQTQRLSWKRPGEDKKSPGRDEIRLPNDIQTSSVSVDFRATPSDIRIEVLNTPGKDGRSFTLSCFTPAGNWQGPWNLLVDSEKLVRTHMDRFTEIPKGEQVLARLQGAGIEFWNSVPPEARDCLQNALKNHKVNTISVFSEEPFIPWELMVPVPKGSPPVDCLGVTYSMGRWVSGDFRAAAQFIPMKTVFIVAPEASGLALAKKEARFLKKTFPGSAQVKPVSFKELDKKLLSSRNDIVHFVCHGKSATPPTLELDPDDTIDSSEVLAMKGFLAAFRKHPFAFLNACEVGKPVRALDGLGGFAYSFLHLGASAVIAPLWGVEDSVAEKVCKQFYADVLRGMTFGEAMKKIRVKAFASGTDTFASYCYYGDPAARAVSKAAV